MSRSTVLFIYNCLLPIFFIVAFPAWLLKMWKRGGYGTGLLQRFGRFKARADCEPNHVVYIHAVSVGEVLIAVKLIESWLARHPDDKLLLAATTSTGLAVAKEKAPDRVRVIYSPLDFGFILRSVFRRFSPRQIVLIEAEAWPNLLNTARLAGIPVAMVNARLSKRSEARFHKVSGLVRPLFAMIDTFAVQNEGDAKRFAQLGIDPDKLHVTGSIKFDPSGGKAPRRRSEFQQMLDDFGPGRPVVLAASTHAGEEKLIGQAVMEAQPDALFLVVPRHAERRAAVAADLKSIGYEVILRSDYHRPNRPHKACLVADTTGELRDWTAHADIVVIGKSWLGEGGQNPAEAIIAQVPVICGPHMGNFEPLISMLRESQGVKVLGSADTLAAEVKSLLNDSAARERLTGSATEVLAVHENAVEKTIDLVYLNASVR
ncbi:3-deoxy-D-manno-octulosonic acid transferase [Verrucomicrobiaceae bacterium R5-34]|uniref:3-deoxy-D-manno-octulosonic acid transferase n=1 Tax=Oceaniferula flava TaxID=2800421 RepID=A0AAE2VEP7_9BACT|nr:3-deoxy-D-manno-octulosonic acid transferase [Oceaniferula flavus]MBK1831769.1 3-deoxy-D-manno-octulosonic acid transferase [Verrucomicrobiaceae bacterium R5-34]MBK1856094.1 3-deoxy-D-manno-octulosonic acid transferase [Oceaniferula flavus]MBM1137401.1 3-deoxy-D-manno-octulosonic acid transferase [Oceaniferula flavus]